MGAQAESKHCPDCGSPLSTEAWGADLCMVCLLKLAAPTPPDEETQPLLSAADTALGSAGGRTTAKSPADSPAVETFRFAQGEVLAGRYRVLKPLGRGGMGEVWRAYDLKLRVDVALKSLNAALAGERGIELMRAEVRAAREVISPNVCRIFDLIEIDGHELVSMEFVDGHTLVRVLDERGPVDVQEAADIGAQLLAGLDAIHTAGLVHRDIKPENIMLTRAKRVVVMDFGLTARSGEGIRAGTPAYMPPEQARGEATDPRADVFAAGLVLAELVSVGGDAAEVMRREIWKSVREDPVTLPELPWRRVLLKAVAADRDDRYESAADMARTLEKVSVRVTDSEDKTPYPGLAAYDEAGAEFFFGREAEVEALWKKLQHANLLGLVGASGAGKSSFVHAGLLPASPEGWAHLEFKPGRKPFAALRDALMPALQYDAEGRGHLEAIDERGRAVAALAAWRKQHRAVLLVVDQFEELFTQNPRDVQRAFADMLAEAAIDADVHVLLSMRDDFLLRCNEFPALAPIFAELTPLQPPFGAALRRALVHPALKCGYQFEDESVVEEMLAEVTKERAALPLIAFTAARLWEERERDTGLLTREAYERIGGVGGALAQHAENILEGIGDEHRPIVRELFRNLVTAQGTRATVDVEEVLTVFKEEQRDDAREVLQALIDGRLLTSYEVRGDDAEESERRVEVVHESLLSAWPRLVRWQGQDADSIQLRDELRQAARRWDSRRRSKDLLWTGTAYREFRIWRKRYPGQLTEIEQAFAAAMIKEAERAGKRRRRVVGTVIGSLLIVVAGMTALWRQSEEARQRAEAQKMVAQARPSLETFPTETLAWALKSLEIADTREGRELAVEALLAGPPAWKVNEYPGFTSYFSPDGSELLQSTRRSETGTLFQLIEADGASTGLEGGSPDAERLGGNYQTSDPDVILSYQGFGDDVEYGLWSASERRDTGELIRLPAFWGSELGRWNAELGGVVQLNWEGEVVLGRFQDGSVRTLTTTPPTGLRTLSEDARWFVQVIDGRIETITLGAAGAGPPQVIGRHAGATWVSASASSGRIATRDDSGVIRIWQSELPGAAPTGEPPKAIAGPVGRAEHLQFSSDGSFLTLRHRDETRTDNLRGLWVVMLTGAEPGLRHLGDYALAGASVLDAERRQVIALIRGGGRAIWHRLDGPAGAEGIALYPGAARNMLGPSFHPDGDWFASQHSWLTVWATRDRYPLAIPGNARSMHFADDGSEFLVSADHAEGGGAAYAWPLAGEMPANRTIVNARDTLWTWASPNAQVLALGGRADGLRTPIFVDRDAGAEVVAENPILDGMFGGDFSPDGKLFVGVGGQFDLDEQVLRVWDVATAAVVAEYAPPVVPGEIGLWHTDASFVGNRSIVWSGNGGTRLWNLDTDEQRLLTTHEMQETSADAAGTFVIALVGQSLDVLRIDIASGAVTELTIYGSDVRTLTLSPDGRTLATIDLDGRIQVGSPTNAEPHLLFSHPGLPNGIAIDPTGRWLGTTSDEQIRLWPLPDVDEPPLHTIPHADLLSKLRSLTNVRLAEDPDAPNGWSLTEDPFPGWETAANQ